MILAVPIESESRKGNISSKFARAAFFAILQPDYNRLDFILNPYAMEDLEVGKNVFSLLIEEHNVNTIMAFELGLKLQQLSHKNKIQLIILESANQTLEQILKLLKM